MPERRSKTSMVPVVWANFGIFSAQSKWFPVPLVTMDETWLYHYDLETKQQSMEWRHSGSPCPKNSECKNLLEKFLPQFFGIKTASSSLIIFQRAKLSMPSITHLCWCNWRTFWRTKCCERVTKGVSFLYDNAPAHRALATQKKLAYLGFHCLDHPPYSLDLAQSDCHLFPELKNQLKCRHFSSDADVIAAAEIWLDRQNSNFFFEWLAKVRAAG